jgi:hypothetical protein
LPLQIGKLPARQFNKVVIKINYTGGYHYARFRYQRFRVSAVLFHNYKEHQYPIIDGQILNRIICIELSPGLLGTVMQAVSSEPKNSGAS